MLVKTLVVGPLEANCYVVGCDTERTDGARDGMILDPGADAADIVRCIEQNTLTPRLIVCTHAHADHIAAAADLKAAFPESRFVISREEVGVLADENLNLSSFLGKPITPPEPDRLLDEGDVVELGEIRFRVIHVPGHTPGGICLYSEDASAGLAVLFSGDALFARGIGRADFPGGDYDLLVEGIKTKLLTLDETCVIYPGHGPRTTVGEEKELNPFLG